MRQDGERCCKTHWGKPVAPLPKRSAQGPTRFSLRGGGTDLIALDGPDATAVGLLLARASTADIVDAHVVLCTQRAGQAVVTSDAADLRRIDPGLRLVIV